MYIRIVLGSLTISLLRFFASCLLLLISMCTVGTHHGGRRQGGMRPDSISSAVLYGKSRALLHWGALS